MTVRDQRRTRYLYDVLAHRARAIAFGFSRKEPQYVQGLSWAILPA